MSIVQRIKRTIGLEEPPSKNTFECEDCGYRFKSGRDEASYWMKCDNCESRDVEMVHDHSA